ncbi:hypothetical protein [Brevibacillus laterosporus]|uniref:hypothetical protein n=1 Tax=Brevibacillus laterosporus TaxID=1465 RepID=UPI000EAE63F2|nr:hypothetical protein [Brevibacillus laterosporus]AYK07763.1 hypothetical protein D8Z77_16075 [Brevibacillus laterosporus]
MSHADDKVVEFVTKMSESEVRARLAKIYAELGRIRDKTSREKAFDKIVMLYEEAVVDHAFNLIKTPE